MPNTGVETRRNGQGTAVEKETGPHFRLLNHEVIFNGKIKGKFSKILSLEKAVDFTYVFETYLVLAFKCCTRSVAIKIEVLIRVSFSVKRKQLCIETVSFQCCFTG